MHGAQRHPQILQYIAGAGPESAAVAPDVEFVGGPRAGERESRPDRPDELAGTGGVYRRGVSCVDDGVLRYVWSSPHG